MTPSHDQLHSASLHAASLVAELDYAQSTHQVSLIAKDEATRRLRFQLLVAQNDCDELRELLSQEEIRSDSFEASVTAHLTRAQTAEARLQEIEHVLRDRDAEIGTLRAESRALQLSAADSEAFLTEKLALTRELASLRPQLDHLRQQAQDAEKLLAEKLELQRLLSDAQCEAENARRDAKRALAKRRNTGVEIAQEEEVAMLKRDLAREKRARQRAEEAAEVTQMDVGVEEVRKELAREKRARHKAEEELETARENTRETAQENGQVEHVRKDLLREKKARAKLEERIEALLADGEREKKAAQKTAEDWESTRATLDEKLGQFRNKLKTTKDKLKETEAQLAAARASKTANPTANPKKRGATAASLDADATTLGTPGDGNPAANKRGRKAAPGVGDKSTFSITPFLNRTASILPEDSPIVENGDGEDSEDDEAKAESPILAKKKAPLAPISTNTKKPAAPRPRKPKQAAAKEMMPVVEEEEDADHHVGEGQENAIVHHPTKTVQTKVVDGSGDEAGATKNKEKKRKRKSLADFKSFDVEPEVTTKTKAGQKSRKLGGMVGKTLFDAEELDEGVRGGKERGVFGGRAFGIGIKKVGGGFLGATKGLGTKGSSGLMQAGDGSGLVFSPLKRRVRNLDDTLMG